MDLEKLIRSLKRPFKGFIRVNTNIYLQFKVLTLKKYTKYAGIILIEWLREHGKKT